MIDPATPGMQLSKLITYFQRISWQSKHQPNDLANVLHRPVEIATQRRHSRCRRVRTARWFHRKLLQPLCSKGFRDIGLKRGFLNGLCNPLIYSGKIEPEIRPDSGAKPNLYWSTLLKLGIRVIRQDDCTEANDERRNSKKKQKVIRDGDKVTYYRNGEEVEDLSPPEDW